MAITRSRCLPRMLRSLGPCGFCGRYSCLNYSKASPQTCVLDALKRLSNFEYKARCEVSKIEKATDGKTATGVTYFLGHMIFTASGLCDLNSVWAGVHADDGRLRGLFRGRLYRTQTAAMERKIESHGS
ncbi:MULTISPECIES: hypothetical protein [Agrobacterium]|uniref:hypothetical protein n=1 Tax=Agrobacterium TaxID=357 RepID=UPI00117897FF|nr:MULTISPECIES: hypothetical protein [Agrobacterium]